MRERRRQAGEGIVRVIEEATEPISHERVRQPHTHQAQERGAHYLEQLVDDARMERASVGIDRLPPKPMGLALALATAPDPSEHFVKMRLLISDPRVHERLDVREGRRELRMRPQRGASVGISHQGN